VTDTTLERVEGWVGPCGRCGAVAWGHWPHPDGEPCPLVEREADAMVSKFNAEREYYEAGAALFRIQAARA